MKDQRPSKRTRRMQPKEIRGKDEGKGEKWSLTRISSNFDECSLDEDEEGGVVGFISELPPTGIRLAALTRCGKV